MRKQSQTPDRARQGKMRHCRVVGREADQETNYQTEGLVIGLLEGLVTGWRPEVKRAQTKERWEPKGTQRKQHLS